MRIIAGRCLMLALLIIVQTVFLAVDALAGGFAIYTQGAASLAQGDAVIAHVEGPETVFFNPALLNRLPGTQIEIATTALFISRDYANSFTSSDTSSDQTFFPSTLYLSQRINDRVSVGFGIFNPFGLGTDWGTSWEGRFLATKSKMTTFTFNPVVSVQVIPGFTAAAGINYLYVSTLEFNRQLNLAPLGLPEASQKFEGDGDGWGVNFGILIEPHKNIAIGLAYRSMISASIDGTVNNSLAPGLPIQVSSLFPTTAAHTKIKFPDQFHAGVAYTGFAPLTVEAAVRWEGWSSFKQLQFNLDQPVAGTNVLVSERNWKDVTSFLIGAKYQLSPTLGLMAGYLYNPTPVPDSTFEPSIPDANSNLLTLGFDYVWKNFKIAAAYSHQWLQQRQKANTIDDNPLDGTFNVGTSANGTYKSNMNMVAISVTYQF